MKTALESKRTLLKPYEKSFRNSFVTLNCNDEIRKHMDGALPRACAEKLFESFLGDGDGKKEFIWAVIEKATDQYMGHAFICFDEEEKEYELGFLFYKQFWGRGFGTEVGRVIVDYAFTVANIQKIIATVDRDHKSSIRILDKLGFNLERMVEDDECPYCVYSAVSD